MVSSSRPARVRKSAQARRAEILAAAARIAVEDGLERITLRAIAERLDVRPGLISHYFPSVDDLVLEAFRAAAGAERVVLDDAEGTPLERMTHFVRDHGGPAAETQNRLWFSARNVSRSSAAMAMALEELEEIGRAAMAGLIEEGIAAGDFGDVDVTDAGVRILMAIDGYGAYVNSPLPFGNEAYEFFVADIAEWALDLAPGTLRGLDSDDATAGRR